MQLTFISKIQNSRRNIVALPWWECEMLKEMPDMMPAPVKKKKKKSKKYLSGIQLNNPFNKNPGTRVKKSSAVSVTIPFAVIY